MSRKLQLINLIGVIALALLCAFQWRMNRALNLQVNDLVKARNEQSLALADQQKAIAGAQADLERFRETLQQSAAALKEAEAKLDKAETDRARLALDNEALKSSIASWEQAVALRDAELKKASVQTDKLASDRNAAVAKFNELADRYNVLVKDLDERTRQLNALIVKAPKPQAE